jgi:hypothetical protein
VLLFFADVHTMREKRAEPRAGIMARIEALWEDEDGTPRVTPARLEDKSEAGACIRIREPIGVGTTLTVQWPNGDIVGKVMYCNRHGEEYVLGILRERGSIH